MTPIWNAMGARPAEGKAELQDVFVLAAERFLKTHSPSVAEYKAMDAIMTCRTVKQGGHVDHCDQCGYEKPSYNSCRNRHCPKCGGLAKERWLSLRLSTVLDVQHLHMVFTVPSELNAVAIANKSAFYSLMFRCVADTIRVVCGEQGFSPGFSAVLHTWGSNLEFHPHLHVPITAGGISTDGGKWVSAKKTRHGKSLASGKYYIAPVRKLSRLFRGKLVSAIRQTHTRGDIRFDDARLSGILDAAMAKEWVVYAKEPFKGARMVYRYLGRYTHRTAISNDRILHADGTSTVFIWRDYRDGKVKTMSLDSCEFIRRFLQHVLETGFTRIRHYGIYSSAAKAGREKARLLTGTRSVPYEKETAAEIMLRVCRVDITRCPVCGGLLSSSPLGRGRGTVP